MIVEDIYVKLVHACGIISWYIHVPHFDFQSFISNQLEMSLLNGHQGANHNFQACNFALRNNGSCGF